jgi:hypothetical protein
MIQPVRLQLSRKKGFNLQRESMRINGLPAVNCARPSRWGNPFVIGSTGVRTAEDAVHAFSLMIPLSWRGPSIIELQGKNLACWCGLDEPCHVDTLLMLANQGTEDL